MTTATSLKRLLSSAASCRLSAPGSVAGGIGMDWGFQQAVADINADCGIQASMAWTIAIRVITVDSEGVSEYGQLAVERLILQDEVSWHRRLLSQRGRFGHHGHGAALPESRLSTPIRATIGSAPADTSKPLRDRAAALCMPWHRLRLPHLPAQFHRRQDRHRLAGLPGRSRCRAHPREYRLRSSSGSGGTSPPRTRRRPCRATGNRIGH